MRNRLTYGYGLVLSGLISVGDGLGGRADEAPDRWLTDGRPHPGVSAGVVLETNRFSSLHLETLDHRLLVCAGAEESEDPGVLTVRLSAAPDDHWLARDWRTRPVGRSGRIWQADLPVEDPDVAIVYYLRSAGAQSTKVSPLRVAFPRGLGIEEPTRLFWPLLEGFEETLDNWRVLPAPSPPSRLQTSPESKNGRASLRVSIPAGQRSVTVATTRVRGWQILHEGATGLRLWLRTEGGRGVVRCSLRAYAFTGRESSTHWVEGFQVVDTWRKMDLPFNELSAVRWRGVDLLVLEFVGEGPCGFLLDDLQFLGPWKLDPP